MKDKKHELKKLKVEKGYKSINWTQVLITVLICVFVTGIIFILGFLLVLTTLTSSIADVLKEGVGSLSEDFGVAIAQNPEIAWLINDDLPPDALFLSLAKQMKADATFEFKGYFTTKEVRSLEKVDLECIDEYTYLHYGKTKDNPTGHISPKKIEYLMDRGCEKMEVSNYPNFYFPNGTSPEKDLVYYKCPTYNCELKEEVRIIPDEFIPESIVVNRLSIGGK